MALVDLEGSEIFERNYDAKSKIVINRGGTRSGKTYNLMIMWVVRSFEMRNKRILVTRLTLPSLRLSAMVDFQAVLDSANINDYFTHNKSLNVYINKKTGTQIHFASSDNPQKVRSQAWDYIQFCEANEIPYETFKQYLLRIKSGGQVYLDFNPSDIDIWINTELEQKRDDITVIQSSYLDNPYLTYDQIKEIELLRETDPKYFQVYGKGEYGVPRNKIWEGWKSITKDAFDKIPSTDEFCGYDDGFISPRAGVRMKWFRDKLYIDQMYYKSRQNVEDYIDVAKKGIANPLTPFYCDPANAEAFNDISQAGINAIKANKKVKKGLNYVRRFDIYVTNRSENIWKEYNKYQYREDINGNVIEEPVKIDDHLMDAIRYGVLGHLYYVFAQ